MSLNLVYKTNSKILWQEVHGEYVLLDPINSKTHELNELAFFIWEKFINYISIDFAIKEVIDAYEVDKNQAIKDTKAITGRFIETGLILRKDEDN